MIVFCSYAQVAQSVEQRTENPRVDGSIPPLGTNYKKLSNTSKAQVAQSVEQRTENPRVDGSIPPLGTMNSKGSDLIGAFFMPDGFVLRCYSCLSSSDRSSLFLTILRFN